MFEVFCSLVSGGTLVIARPDGHRDPVYCSELIERHGVNLMHFVPTMLQAYLEHGRPERNASLDWLLCSGEALAPALRARFERAFAQGKTRLSNLYGPTEGTIDVSAWNCERNEARTVVPIGHPIDNCSLFVVDRAGNLLPRDASGELLIGGVCLAQGYAGEPALTAAAFIPDELSGEAGARLYRTGDWVRRAEDGALEFLGRKDSQIKLRGVRIEIGEIESNLMATGLVADCAVTVSGSGENARLVAFVVAAVPEAGGRTQAQLASAIRERLQATLQPSLVPTEWRVRSSIPRTASGKIDRKLLGSENTSEAEPSASPLTDSERQLARIWSATLALPSPES